MRFNFKYDIIRPIQKFFTGYAYSDWWDARSTMAKKILPIIRDFRNKPKHGQPCGLDDDWQHILDEIYFAVEYAANEDDSDCDVLNPDYNPDQKEPFTMVGRRMDFNKDYGRMMRDNDLWDKKLKRVENGFKLLGEHWLELWD